MALLRALCTLSLATTAVIVGCANNTPGPAVGGTQEYRSGVTSAQGADTAVVDRLSRARCDQEERCNNIGANAKYASRDVCMDSQRGSIANDLNADKCPRGLAQDGVDHCMAAIKSEECGHPMETLSRYDACRSSAMCMR